MKAWREPYQVQVVYKVAYTRVIPYKRLLLGNRLPHERIAIP